MINLFFVVHDYSGARTYANELLGYLEAQKGIIVYKVYLESSAFKEYAIVEQNRLTEIHFPVVSRKGFSLEKYSRRCIDLLTPLIEGKKNIIFHLNYSTQVKFGQEARKRFGARLVYTLHYLPNYFSCFDAGTIQPEEVTTTGDVLDKEIAASADHIICVTRFAQEMLKQIYSISGDKLSVIYNGTSPSIANTSHHINKDEIKRKHGFSTQDILILFVGRLQWGKGVEKLMEAFNLLVPDYENLHLVLVGNGEFEPLMKAMQGNYGQISFTGKLTASQVKQLYGIADIGVIPSEFEQCSYVALEMMQYGLPIVCSNAPGLKELFSDKESASIVPMHTRKDDILGLEISTKELYETIKQLLEDKSLGEKQARNAHGNWEKAYTAIHMGEATICAYKRLKEVDVKGSRLDACSSV